MKKSNINIDWTIFRKAVTSGELNPDEKALFNVWLESSRTNKKYFQKAQAFYKNQDEIKDLDYKLAFEKFEKGIDIRPTFHLQWLKTAAAAIFAVLVSGSVVYLLLNKSPKSSFRPIANAEKIFPAAGQAMLTLSDGRQVLLNSKADTLIQQGTDSLKSTKGRVDYLAFESKTESMRYNTLSLPRGVDYRLILSDSTVVWLNAESSITYPVSFASDKRMVSITGEAYFEVTHNDKKPFIVDVGGTKITVLGTKFNVNSYSEKVGVYTTLVQGSVKVATTAGKTVVLKPDEQAFSGKDGGVDVSQVDANQVIDWVAGRFDFEDQRLEDIMDELSRWYDLDVFYEGEKVKDLRFTGYVNRYQDVNELLGLLEITNAVEFYMKEKTVMVRRRR